jgi:hypothetical protein
MVSSGLLSAVVSQPSSASVLTAGPGRLVGQASEVSAVTPKVPPPAGGVQRPLTVTVRPAVTHVTVTSTAQVVGINQPVTYFATVGSPVRTTGTVNFYDGGLPIAGCQGRTLPANPPYVVTCTQSYPSLGQHSITALFSGAPLTTLGSLSPPYIEYIEKANVSHGYWLVASDGGIFAFGDAGFYGSMGGHPLNMPAVGIAATIDGKGYWVDASDGGIFSFGDARFHGSMGSTRLNQPIVGMSAMPNGGGYWLVGSDGGIFAFGSAKFYGSMGGVRLNQKIVGMVATTDGKGYWLVAADGGVFAFGDARYYGSTGGQHLTAAVVGIAPTADNDGYWLDAADGGVFGFGDAHYFGSMGGHPLNRPVVGMAPTVTGHGYWLDASDGGIFTFGDANFYGSMGGQPLNRPMVGMAAMAPTTFSPGIRHRHR